MSIQYQCECNNDILRKFNTIKFAVMNFVRLHSRATLGRVQLN